MYEKKKTSYLPQLSTPVLCCWKKPKPFQKFRRRHHSLFVVLFHLFMNGVASQDEEKEILTKKAE
jgi:hypothetical protein